MRDRTDHGFSIVMMSSITRIRTARRRSSRLSTWLYSDGPLVLSWVAAFLMVSESTLPIQKASALDDASRLSLRASHGLHRFPRAQGGRPLTVLAG